MYEPIIRTLTRYSSYAFVIGDSKNQRDASNSPTTHLDTSMSRWGAGTPDGHGVQRQGLEWQTWIQLPRGSSARCLRAWPCWHHYPCSTSHMLSGWPWCGGPEEDRVPENIPIEIEIFNQQATYLSWLKFFDEGNGRNNQFSSWGSLTLLSLVFCLSKLPQGFTAMCFHWSSCLRRESDWC